VLGLPFVIITVSVSLQGFNHNLLRAAATLGASPLTAFHPCDVAADRTKDDSCALFAFATSFDDIVVTLFLAAPG
jgi:putative spermidine/putrescine transport system permease protein